MGVIKRVFSPLTIKSVIQTLVEQVAEPMLKAGLNEEQIATICSKVVSLALKNKQRYTEMGGYPPHDQLLDEATKLMNELDEREELVTLIDDLEIPQELLQE